MVVVATIQSFRIDDTDKHNVYSFSERFERHFKARDDQQLRALRDLPDAVVTAAEDHVATPAAYWLALWVNPDGVWPTGWRCTNPC